MDYDPGDRKSIKNEEKGRFIENVYIYQLNVYKISIYKNFIHIYTDTHEQLQGLIFFFLAIFYKIVQYKNL